MHFQALALYSALLSTVAAQTTITATQTPNASQASKIQADVNSYISSLTTQPSYSSFTSAVASFAATATEISYYDSYELNTENWGPLVSSINSEIVATAPAGVPTELVQYIQSIGQAQASIVNKDMSSDASGPRAERSMIVMGLVAGAACAFALAL